MKNIELKDKNVLIIGAGISGFAAAEVCKRFGANVTLSDAKDEDKLKYDLSKLRNGGITVICGKQENTLLDGCDLVIVSPAVPVRIPLVQEAMKRGITVTSEVELAWNLAKAPIYAVTGTNGKTTTVTLLGELMKTKYDTVGVGGNIGIPLCEEVLRVGTEGCTVAEISSYQMEASKDFHPAIAAELNVTPDHVVRHGNIEVYQQMKEKLFANQTKDDYLVLNYDNDRTRSMAERAENTNVFFFSREKELEEGAFLKDGVITLRHVGNEVQLCRASELRIKGGHNVENALAASAVAFLAGAPAEGMTQVLKTFGGVEHRIEPVAEINGVAYFNDSKATNTDSAIKALESFEGHLILLAGGDDKHTDLHDFMVLVKDRVEELILLGDASERFKKAALDEGFSAEHIHEAGYSMPTAVEMAKNLSHEGQTVLLSPACASFDMYDGFEERGRDFKKLVHELEH